MSSFYCDWIQKNSSVISTCGLCCRVIFASVEIIGGRLLFSDQTNVANYCVYYAFNIVLKEWYFSCGQSLLRFVTSMSWKERDPLLDQWLKLFYVRWRQIDFLIVFVNYNSFPPCFSPVSLPPFLLIALIV